MAYVAIEYTDCSWSPYTGCLHGKDICAASATCWARAMSKRFEQVCGGDFEPRFHLSRLDVPRHWAGARHVATCFMGDLFGSWLSYDVPESDLTWGMQDIVSAILDVVHDCPQHQFLFLTKRPENLAQFNPWPVNAWVGTSITGAETPERQAEMLEALHQVEGAGVRWLSYEPALGPLAQPIPAWLDWVVAGSQSGGNAHQPDVGLFMGKRGEWKLWEKNSLAKLLPRPLTQELPC